MNLFAKSIVFLYIIAICCSNFAMQQLLLQKSDSKDLVFDKQSTISFIDISSKSDLRLSTYEKLIEELIKQCPRRINARDVKNHYCPLDYASILNWKRLCDFLKKNGAKHSETYLMELQKDIDQVPVTLQIYYQQPLTAMSILDATIMLFKSAAIMKAYKEWGEDLSEKSFPLHFRTEENIKHFIAQGGDINAPVFQGLTIRDVLSVADDEHPSLAILKELGAQHSWKFLERYEHFAALIISSLLSRDYVYELRSREEKTSLCNSGKIL